jgi:hypothetical protein
MYKWFGGSHHHCYAIFITTSERINGVAIGLIRPAGTRMGGYWIVWTRVVRLRPIIEVVLADPAFKGLPAAQRPPKDFIDILLDPRFWKGLIGFLQAMFGPLRVLRLCDTRAPSMDKVLYYALRTEEHLLAAKKKLDKWDDLHAGKANFVCKMHAVISSRKKSVKAPAPPPKVATVAKIEIESDSEFDDDASLELAKVDSDEEIANQPVLGREIKLGDRVLAAWRKRMLSLTHGYSIAGWMLCPCRLIQIHAWSEHTEVHKEAVNDLIRKIFIYPNNRPEECDEAFMVVSENFWEEWRQFIRREGFFDKDKVIWKSPLIEENQSWLWHLNYSYKGTHFLGHLACRVTSKITGIGSAERNWGDVKSIKSGKRIAMSSDTLNMQTTIYGSACVEKSMRKKNFNKQFTYWEDTDMDKIGLDKYCNFVTDADGKTGEDRGEDRGKGEKGGEDGDDKSTTSSSSESSSEKKVKAKRVFYCHLETWEPKCAINDSNKNVDQLMRKYGGIWFHDGTTKYTINGLVWYKKDKKYMMRGVTEDYDEEKDDKENKGKYKMFDIDNDTLGIIWDSHFKRRNKNGNGPNMDYDGFIVKPNKVDLQDDGTWGNYMDKEDSDDEKDKKTKTKTTPAKKNTPKKRKRT